MNISSNSARASLAAIAILCASTTLSYAGPQDYEFQPTSPTVKQGQASPVSVRLVDKRTGKAVPDAVIFTTRMDMAPEGMESMTTPVVAVASSEPGVYAFKSDFVMVGNWRFKLAAKVQGETDTVQGEVVLKAAP